MVDKRLEVLKVETDQGTKYVVGSDLEALKKDHTDHFARDDRSCGVARQLYWPRRARIRLLLASDTDALARGLGVSSDCDEAG